MLEIKIEGFKRKIYQDGHCQGIITKVKGGFKWENCLANTVKSLCTSGFTKFEINAFAHLGYKLVPVKEKKDGIVKQASENV